MECQNVGTESFEIFLVIIGAILGFVLSILTTIINKAIDKHGKMRIFYKLVHQKITEQKARIYSSCGETFLVIPMYFELQNTSNTARVIRDVCLYLYNDGKKTAKMNQIQYTQNSKTKEITNSFGGEKSSYSFVLPPLSIQKQECEFLYKLPSSKIDELPFDEIRFSYFDEKNRVMECLFCEAKQGWAGVEFNYENEYFELKCKRKRA